MKVDNATRKILLVDDDIDDRKYFMEALQEIDPSIVCEIAKDGQQGLDILNDFNVPLPDFIFLDLRLPRFSGRQCLSQIKADARLKNIPVVIYTTSREPLESENLHDLGAVHFISKPTDPDEIYYVLSMVLEEQWGSRLFQ